MQDEVHVRNGHSHKCDHVTFLFEEQVKCLYIFLFLPENSEEMPFKVGVYRHESSTLKAVKSEFKGMKI